MSNGEVQPEIKPKRISKIRKAIERKFSTAKYESLVIHDEIEEEIEWSTLEERQQKISNWETVLLQNFSKLQTRVFDELDLAIKKAYFQNNLEDKDMRLPPGEKHEFDGLDEVG